ncbi:hypothetical protein [Streptomyces prasinus]|uniref:hypothetical protein n=1 Tax=Streptomyces prasinus TaxID=67345 RepID=UPI0036310914
MSRRRYRRTFADHTVVEPSAESAGRLRMDGHVLYQFPSTEQMLSRSPEGWVSVALDWRPAPAP